MLRTTHRRRRVIRRAANQPTAISLDQFSGTFGGSKVQGRLALRTGEDARLDGTVEADTIETALAAWERRERPLTEHTQRISLMLGWPATWPPFLRAAALSFAGKSKWMVRQRTKTALHRPTGT